MACGNSRQVNTAGGHRDKGTPLTCLRCGRTLFTAERSSAPPQVAGFIITKWDREFLAGLRIGREVVS